MNRKMNRRKFDNILDECLEKVLKGESIDACLAAYPDYADELKPLLETALDTRKAAAVSPRPDFRRRAALDFQKAIQEMPVKTTRPGFRWQTAWMAPFAAFLVILFASLGTAAAARNALPDSSLYNVKLATESVQLALTFSDIDKAELYARLNDKRVAEIVEMAEQGKAVQVVKATDLLASNMVAMADLTSGDGKSADANGLNAFWGMSSEEAVTPPQATQPLPERGYDTATTTAPTTSAPPPTSTTTNEPSPAEPPLASPYAAPPAPPYAAPPAPTTTLVTIPPDMIQETFGLGGGRDRIETEEDLKAFLTEKQLEALRVLYDQLERAPDWLKPQIQAAIDIIFEGYNTSIYNLRG